VVIAKVHAEQGNDPRQIIGAHRPALIERVQDLRRLAIEPDVPAPVTVLDLGTRLDAYLQLHHVLEPGFRHTRERVQRRLLEAEVDHRVEAVRPVPIDLLVVVTENVELDRPHRRTGLGQKLRQAGFARAGVHLHDLLIGEQQAVTFGRNGLLAKEQLGSPQPHGIAHVLEDIAQDQVDQLIDEDGGCRRVAPPRDPQVGALDRSRRHQQLPEREHDAVIVGGVGVGQPGEPRLVDRHERISQQLLVKPDLLVAGGLDRMHFGPRPVGQQELRCDLQPALRAHFDQMIARRFPEVSHHQSGSTVQIRACIGSPVGGLIVRNSSLIWPSESKKRRTVKTVLIGTSRQRSTTKASSSCAAGQAASVSGAPQASTKCRARRKAISSAAV